MSFLSSKINPVRKSVEFFSNGVNKIYELIMGEKMGREAELFAKNLFRAFLGYGVAGFCVFAFEILAGRILGPETYGKYVLVATMGLFLYLFVTFGVNTSAIKYGVSADDETRKKIISSAYFITALSSLVFGLGFFILSRKISIALSIPLSLFRLSIVFGILLGFYVISTDSLRAVYEIKKLSLFRACYGFLIITLLLFFSVLSRGSFFIALLPIFISYLVVFLSITFNIRKRFIFKWDSFWIKKLLNYGIFAALGGLMFTFLPILSQLFVNKYSSLKNVGIYAAYYFSSINVAIFLYNIFIVVFFPTMSKLRQKHLVIKKIGKIIPFLFLIGAPLLFLTQIVSLKFYGSQYPLNILLVLAFDMSAILICIYGLYSWFFYSLGIRQVKKITVLTLFMFLANIMLNFYLVPRFTLWGAIFSVFLTYLVGLIFLSGFLKKEKNQGNSLRRHLKFKVCHIVSADMTARFILLNHLLSLKNEGYDVSVVCSVGKYTREIKELGIKVKLIKIKRKIFTPVSDLLALVKMILYLNKEKINIVHTHTPKAGILGRFAAKLAGVPIIVHTNHGFYFHEGTPLFKRKFFVFLEKTAAWCCDLIFSINKEDIQTAVKEKICKKEKIKYSGDGIDTFCFKPNFSEDFINQEKAKLGIGKQDKVIGFVGRLVEEKGVKDLLFASSVVRKNFSNAIFLIIGPKEPDRKDCFDPEPFMKEHNLGGKILFLCETKNISKLYALMDILVLPSHREGLGLVLLEASAMEKPVIGTDIRGCREAVDKNKTGLLVPPKNSKELAKAIVYLISNPEVCEKMGKAGRKKVLEEFDEKLVFDRIKKEYEKLILEKGI